MVLSLAQSDLSTNLWVKSNLSNLSYLGYFSLISNLNNTKLVERSNWTLGELQYNSSIKDKMSDYWWIVKENPFLTQTSSLPVRTLYIFYSEKSWQTRY